MVMDIKSLADLSQLVDLCRKKGIDTIKVTGDCVEFKLAENTPVRRRTKKDAQDKAEEQTKYSDEDVLFWSSLDIGNEKAN